MNLHRARPALLTTLILSSLLAGTTHAASFCATTGEQLASALNTADSNNANDEIRVSIGFMTRPSLADGLTRWSYVEAASDADNDLVLSGGWNTTCTTKLPSVTSFLDAELGGPMLDIQLSANSFASIQISDFNLVRGYTNTAFGFSGFRVSSPGTQSPLIVVERVHVRNSGSDGDSSGIVRFELASGSLTYRNSQITQNRSYSGASLIVSAEAQATINISNNTVMDNTDSEPNSTGPVGGASIFGSGTINVYNNVFWDNTSSNSVDVSVQNGTGLLTNNHIGVLRGAPEFNANRTQGDPLITFNNSWFPIPSQNSPLKDSGSSFVPGGAGSQDLMFRARTQGARIDRGAVEIDQMFGNGFE